MGFSGSPIEKISLLFALDYAKMVYWLPNQNLLVQSLLVKTLEQCVKPSEK